MTESFVERRRRELREANGGSAESASSFVERRRKELRGQADPVKNETTKKILDITLDGVMNPGKKQAPAPTSKPKEIDFMAEVAKSKEVKKVDPLQGKLPAPSILVGNDTKVLQNNLQNKLPAASMLTSTGGGPANASKIPGVSQYEINKKYIEENAPSIVKPFSNTMNYLTEGNPIGIAIGNAFSGNSGATLKDSSGNKTVDKVADAINNFVTPILTPTGAPLGQGIIGSSYEGVGNALKSAAGQKAINTIATGVPFAGQTAARNITRVGLTEGIAGAMQGVGIGLQQGDDSGRDIARNAIMGGAGGAVLGTAGAAIGEAGTSFISRFLKSKGIPEEDVLTPDFEILPPRQSNTLALPEGRGTIRKSEAMGRSNLAPNAEPIVNPTNWTPEPLGLPQGTPVSPTTARRGTPTNIYKQKFEALISEARKQEFSPGREDIELENLWSQMADRNDPSLNELIDLAYPKRTTPTPEKGMIKNARNYQMARDVYGIGNPVKSSAERANVQVLGEAAAPQTIIAKVGAKPIPKPVSKPKATLEEAAKVEPVKTTRPNGAYQKLLDATTDQVAATVEAPVKPVVKGSPIVTEVKKPSLPKKVTPGTRANYKTIEESGNVSSTLKGKLENSTNKTYTIFKDADANRLANDNVKNLDTAESRFLNNDYKGKESIATGYRVSQELDRLANATKDPDLKKALFGRALSALDKVTADLTRAGQESQAGSLIKRMSPEGQLQNLIRKAKANDLEVKVADSVTFKEEATKYIEADGAGMRENDLSDSFDRLSKGTATKEDMLKIERLMDTAREKIGGKKAPVKDRLPKELNDVRKRDKVVSFLDEAVADAEKRIKKRRGNLNSLPVAEWTDYSIIAASKVAKGIIKAETHIEDLVKLFGEEIRPVATQIFEKAQQLVAGVTKSTLEGDLLKANDAFKRITGQVKASKQERLVEKYIMENPVVEKDVEYLRKLSKSLTELQGTDKIKADMAMQKILNSYEKSSVNDKINAVRYISMLLNDATQTINALSGPLMATYGSTVDVLGSMVDIAMSATFKTPRSTTLYGTNPIRFLANWFKYGKIGAKAGYEGVNPSGIQGTNEVRGLAFKSKLNPLGQAERILGAVAKGADYATYRTVYESELNKQGFLDALENGIKRSDKAAIKQHVRKFVNDPPIEAMEQADRIGKNTTFQRSDSLGGKTANWINASPKLVKPGVNAILPFVRTPLNITSTAVTATPAGIIKGLFQLSSMSQASQREAIRSLSMGIGGVGMTSIGFYLSKVGIITGANDTGNKDANSINEQAGRAKFRFNTSAAKRYTWAMLNGEGADAAEAAAKYQKGDKQFDYNKLQPLAFPLAMGAGYQEKKGSVGSKIAAAGTQSYGSLFGMSSLKGVQEVFQPQYTGTQADKAIDPFNRVIESYLKSFSPSFLAQEARRLDPVQRKTAYNEGIKADVTDYFKSRIPGLSQTLPEKKDTLGNTKVYPEGVVGQHLNPYKSEVANYSTAAALIADLIERTGDQSLAPSAPPKNFTRDGVKIDIPTKRYEKLQVDIGQEITKRIIEIEGGTDAELIEQINEIYSDVRDEYMDEVKDEL